MEEGSAGIILPPWCSLLEIVQTIEHNFETLHLDRNFMLSLLIKAGFPREELDAKLEAARQDPLLQAETAEACREFREPLKKALEDAATDAIGGSPKGLIN